MMRRKNGDAISVKGQDFFLIIVWPTVLICEYVVVVVVVVCPCWQVRELPLSNLHIVVSTTSGHHSGL